MPSDGDRIRATFNRLWPDSRTIISKLVQRPLAFEVMPNSSDDVAVEGAKLGDSILYALAREHEWEAKREALAWATWKGGVAAIAVDWNPALGKPTALADDGRKLPSGDTVETVLSVAEFVIQPGATDARKAHWWIKAQVMPPDEAKAAWNLSFDPVADATAGASSLEKGLLAANRAGINAPGQLSNEVDLTLVLTYYERPNRNNEDGKVEVIINNKSVWGPKPWPFPFVDHLNLAFARETAVENSWIGDTVVTIARPVQAAYNAAWSNLLEHADIAGNARLATPQSAFELSEQYSDRIGEMILYQDGSDVPKWISPPQLPGWLLQMPSEIRSEIDDILGVHDISRGAAPANIESGYGLAVLAEHDATPLGKLSSSIAQVFGQVGSMALMIYAAEVKETRTAVVQMPGEPPDTVPWTGADLAGQTTATVPLELVAPRSQAALAALAEKMMQMGLIETIEDMVNIAELPGQRQLIDAVKPDVGRARRENSAMAQGVVRLPEDWDDHVIHLAEINRFRKSARYEALPAETKAIFAAHAQAHETLAAEEAGRQQANAQTGGPALASSPSSDGSETIPVSEEPVLPPVDPNAPPPIDEQTVIDQLTGNADGAVARMDAEAMATGAATTQQDIERDAILELTRIATGKS